jgi:AcrR family transcriptional regulator
MAPRRKPPRQPRKAPVQARSEATWVAILEATIQVLGAQGFDGLTTTRVAERAGVSVGTLYQYFPNKHALVLTVLERHVDAVATMVEEACAAHHGAPLATMVSAMCGAFIGAKLRRRDMVQALQHASAELGGDEVVRRRAQRTVEAIVAMLGTSPEIDKGRVALATSVLVPAIVGVVDTALARRADAHALRAIERELTVLGTAYLHAAAA